MRSNHQKETQKTPKEKYEIPIPKRGDFLKNLKRVATPSMANGPKK